MATPNPLEPVKGAGPTLWVYNGKGDAYANPLSDDDWQRPGKVKEPTPGATTDETRALQIPRKQNGARSP
ncbi:phage tail tube protein, partial [Escherichia coli]|uniref:phage tail tube protein n=1 Tax=Escherichia coli TaxID=562 RepID=UPI0025A2DD4E